MNKRQQLGFTLIEVMVALVVVSIGLGALLAATSQNIRTYQRLQTHMAENWVSLQTVNMLRIGLISLQDNQPSFTVTRIKNLKIYSKVEKKTTSLPFLKQIKISTRALPRGAYDQINYTYTYESNT
jgi:prepilin-type N-terminal cleavage/methylation domain-containing protein